jgi:predicted nucleic acid-binding protein
MYFDTTIVNYLDYPEKPEKERDTLMLWEEAKSGKYEIVLSEVFFKELNRCPEPKRQKMLDKLEEITYTVIDINEDTERIANEIIRLGILSDKQYDDCSHIGCAIYSQCDCLVSWNFKHLANNKTIKGVRSITNLLGYKTIDIVSPPMVLATEEA